MDRKEKITKKKANLKVGVGGGGKWQKKSEKGGLKAQKLETSKVLENKV